MLKPVLISIMRKILLLLTVAIICAVWMPGQSLAAVDKAVGGDWSLIWNGTINDNSTTQISNVSAAAGTDRVFLVFVGMETSGTAGFATNSVSWGTGNNGILIGQAVANNRELGFMYYFPESQIPASPTRLDVFVDFTAGVTAGTHIGTLTLENVDQNDPLVGFAANGVQANNVDFGSTVNYVIDGMSVFYVTNRNQNTTGITVAGDPVAPNGFSDAGTMISDLNNHESWASETGVHDQDGAFASTVNVLCDSGGTGGTAVIAASWRPAPLAQNNLTAGVMSFTSVNSTTINVEVAFTGDDNENGTCQIDYGTTGLGGPFPFALITTKDDAANTCSATASGLLEETTYYFEASISDSDGVSGSPVTGQQSTTGNAMLHNSDNLGTKYWAGSGGWGVNGGQYGKFDCSTCHSTVGGSSNIKRIRSTILGNTVNFQKITGAGASFGDDGDGRGGSNSTRPCEVCHTQTDYHRRTTSSTPSLTHNNQLDCIQCHPHNLGFKASGACDSCHDINSSNPSAPKVVDISGGTLNGQAYGSHLKITPSDDLSSVGAWEDQCGQCHEMHDGAVFIPNNPAVGIDYPGHGGIYLGGASTNAMINTKTTEADICWGCHDNNGGTTSEWNAMAADGFTVNGGSNWTTAVFDLVGNSIPDRAALSIHTANAIDTDSGGDVRNSSVANNVNWSGSVGTLRDGVGGQPVPVLENVSAIRCSYCHDVHGTADYTGVISAANDPDDAPYLRGTWMANPYPIERPPETGDTYPGNVFPNPTGGGSFPAGFNTPRLFANSAGSASIGGFFIDQNSGYPTRKGDNTYMTVDDVGGLCMLCHDKDENDTAVTVDSMDYYTSNNLWQGTNGHSNSTVSGTGSNATDIFDARRGNSTFNMHFQGLPSGSGNDRRWGKDRNGSMPNGNSFVGSEPDRANSSFLPPRNTGWYGGTAGATDRNPSTEYSRWYNGAGGSGAIGSNGDGFTNRAHSFSCSKCHTPHASGLPALLLTNCLDPAIATWSNNQLNTTVGPGAWGGANTRNRFNAMGNCHRNEGTASGWNKLAEGE